MTSTAREFGERTLRRLLGRSARRLRQSAERRDAYDARAALARFPVGSQCRVCGAISSFYWRPVISRRLSRQWRLPRDQRALLNVQQGHICRFCGNNLRGRVLAATILNLMEVDGVLSDIGKECPGTSVLEVNPAAFLTPYLSALHNHTCTSFPNVDMQALPFPSGEFDFVIHSDVLEHVEHPEVALRECLRVAGRGWVVFTTPALTDRLTRSRAGRRPSFHGGDHGASLVRWEFGADFVDVMVAAGATTVLINAESAPYVLVYSCRRDPRPVN